MTKEEKLPFERRAAKINIEQLYEEARFFDKYKHLYTEEELDLVAFQPVTPLTLRNRHPGRPQLQKKRKSRRRPRLKIQDLKAKRGYKLLLTTILRLLPIRRRS
jgi:hypothetical protein